MNNTDAPENQRIDRWLWCARFFKTRTLAAKFVSSNSVRVERNGQISRIEKPAAVVRAGDILIFSPHTNPKIVQIKCCAIRRGPAAQAQMLYDDRSPPASPKVARSTIPFERDKGAGRPTKKDRRDLVAAKQPDF